MPAELAASYQLPDLVSLCGDAFDLCANPYCRNASEASLQWAMTHGVIDEDMRSVVKRLKIGLLASLCYPTCDYPQLKTVVDFMTCAVFGALHLGSAYDDVWLRLTRSTSDSWQANFQPIPQAVRGPEQLGIPGIRVSGLLAQKTATAIFESQFALIEYAKGFGTLNRQDSIVQQLGVHALEIVTWMNEMASYHVKQAKSDKNNLIAKLMQERNLLVQAAMYAAAKEIQTALGKFLELEQQICDVNTHSDTAIREYVQGLRDCIIGFAHWVYETDLYFQGRGEDVKTFGWVFLLPKSDIDPVGRWTSEVKQSSKSTA